MRLTNRIRQWLIEWLLGGESSIQLRLQLAEGNISELRTKVAGLELQLCDATLAVDYHWKETSWVIVGYRHKDRDSVKIYGVDFASIQELEVFLGKRSSSCLLDAATGVKEMVRGRKLS